MQLWFSSCYPSLFTSRIHYPLPLPYQGKPDPVALQDTIRDLRSEIKRLKVQVGDLCFLLLQVVGQHDLVFLIDVFFKVCQPHSLLKT